MIASLFGRFPLLAEMDRREAPFRPGLAKHALETMLAQIAEGRRCERAHRVVLTLEGQDPEDFAAQSGREDHLSGVRWISGEGHQGVHVHAGAPADLEGPRVHDVSRGCPTGARPSIDEIGLDAELMEQQGAHHADRAGTHDENGNIELCHIVLRGRSGSFD